MNTKTLQDIHSWAIWKKPHTPLSNFWQAAEAASRDVESWPSWMQHGSMISSSVRPDKMPANSASQSVTLQELKAGINRAIKRIESWPKWKKELHRV